MKCILWGYPLHTDTYSYVHEGFKKALERAGHEVFWFHDNDYPEDFDWYLKWVASIIVLCSLAMRAAGPEFRFYDLSFGVVGIALWCWVSVIWKDRALIMLNTVSLFMLGVALLKEFQ